MTGARDKGIFTVFSEEYRNLRPQPPNECTANNVANDDPFTVSDIHTAYTISVISSLSID